MVQTAALKKKKPPLFKGRPTPYTTQTTNTGGILQLIYYGARYLDPKTSRWLSTDPALGEYVPVAGRKNNNLPNGGVYNYTNLHTYHYSNNNPVKYFDPDGRIIKNPFNHKSIRDRIIEYFLGNRNSTDGQSLFRSLHYNELALANEILGIDVSGYNIKLGFADLPDGDGVSLPGGFVGIHERFESSDLTSQDFYAQNIFIHEIFHQVQYNTDITAAFHLGYELARDQIDSTFDPYKSGRYGDTDLSTYNTLNDIPFYEGRAQLVGDFAELYLTQKSGFKLGDKQQDALREQARILRSSGYNSTAINSVLDQ